MNVKDLKSALSCLSSSITSFNDFEVVIQADPFSVITGYVDNGNNKVIRFSNTSEVTFDIPNKKIIICNNEGV